MILNISAPGGCCHCENHSEVFATDKGAGLFEFYQNFEASIDEYFENFWFLRFCKLSLFS